MVKGPISLVKDSFLISAPALDSGGGGACTYSTPYLLTLILLPQALPPTKRESVTVIKKSVINHVPLRNNEASNAVGAIDGGLVKLMWFSTPPLFLRCGGGEPVDSALSALSPVFPQIKLLAEAGCVGWDVATHCECECLAVRVRSQSSLYSQCLHTKSAQ